MRFPSRTIVAAVLLFLSAPPVDAAYTSAIVGTTGTMTGDLAGDTLTITQAGGLFSHNRFAAGDPGFNSAFDFDTTVLGDQTLSAATGIINIDAGDGNDTIALGDGINIRGTINGNIGTDTLDYAASTTAISANLGLGTTGLSATLGADQENPPTTHAATGTATVTNYNIVTHTFDITVTVVGITPAEVTGFHIHQAAVGVNGPIIVDFVPLGGLVPVGSGFTFTMAGLTLPAVNEAAFLGGGTYVNVHTAVFPGGAIRGQLFSGGNVNLATGAATGADGITNIENVTGGTGNDSVVGNFAVNTIIGGAGADWIVGGPGNDTLTGGAGADVLVWSNGDGTDVDEGGTEADIVQVNGSTAAGDIFTVTPNGARLRFDRTNLGLFSLDIGTVETLIVNGIGGADSFTVNDLAGVASLTTLRLNGFAGDDIFTLVPTSAGAIAFNAHGGTDTDLLQGPNGTTTWNVTASNQGNIAGLVTAFSFIEALSGGTAADTFNVRAFATGTPTVVAGNGGVDTLNYNAESRAISGDTTPPDGNIDSPGVQSVIFTQIETLNVGNPQPMIAIGDVTVAEGGTPGNAVFSVTLSNASLMTITVNFATADGTAIAPGDYTARTGMLTFVPGDTVETVSVPITDDALSELTETFVVNLAGALNASIADPQGQGTITDDDAASVSVDLAIDFGAAGLWALYNNTFFEQLTRGNPEEMATGDVDHDGRADLIADFRGAGVWIWQNNTAWSRLHAANASAIATGDLDGNGQDEVLIVFPGFGLWVFSNNSGFYRLHDQDPNRMILGDLDGNGQDEVILNFPGHGIWVFENNTTWIQLHAANAASFAVGDFDGGGRADLLADFPGFGLWVYTNNDGWFLLHGSDATVMTAGDIDGNGQDDAIITFPGFGIWAWMNDTGFKKLHVADGAILRTADIDGSGRADVVVSFPGFGIWAWMNDTNWIQIHDRNPEGITEGRLDGN